MWTTDNQISEVSGLILRNGFDPTAAIGMATALVLGVLAKVALRSLKEQFRRPNISKTCETTR